MTRLDVAKVSMKADADERDVKALTEALKEAGFVVDYTAHNGVCEVLRDE